MQVFFDIEFASTEPDKNGYRYLIRLGCVATDGREFYAELTDTWDDHLCSLFTLNIVLPLLQGGDCRMGVSELAVRLKAWIEGITDKEVVFHSDAPDYDWPFIKEIFDHNGWPVNLRKKCGTIYFNHDSQFAVISPPWGSIGKNTRSVSIMHWLMSEACRLRGNLQSKNKDFYAPHSYEKHGVNRRRPCHRPLPHAASMCQNGSVKPPITREGASVMKITTIGIDLAKDLFQIHGVDSHGKAVLRKQMRRSEMTKFFVNLPPCSTLDIQDQNRGCQSASNFLHDSARVFQR